MCAQKLTQGKHSTLPAPSKPSSPSITHPPLSQGKLVERGGDGGRGKGDGWWWNAACTSPHTMGLDASTLGGWKNNGPPEMKSPHLRSQMRRENEKVIIFLRRGN